MTVIKVDNFGGEMPSVSPRALPPEAAQVNKDLYLATREFRPLMQDRAVATTANGTKTMHRFARDAAGNFNSDPSINWITSTSERSYVKGQINDERSERTYVSFDDGSARPRVIDVNGADRVLGVPRPVLPVVTANITDEFTPTEANDFLFGDAAEAVRQALIAAITDPKTNEPASRFTGTTILAGPYSAHGLAFPTATTSALALNYWNLYGVVDPGSIVGQYADKIRLGAYQDSATGLIYIPITCLPMTGIPDRTKLEDALRLIEQPADAGGTSGSQLFTDAVISEIATKAIDYMTPSKFAKSQRDELEALVKEFASIPASSTIDASSAVSINSRVAEIQARATAVTHEIEVISENRYKALTGDTKVISSNFTEAGGVSALLGDTVERIIDTRFYIVTFVTDWGEESEPSDPTDMLEIDQNDSVTINRPGSTSGESYAERNIEKWRIYRSNSGSQSAAFQFVEELLVTSDSFTDEKKGAELGEVCPTITWSEPPYRMDAQYDGFPKPVVGTNPFLRGLVGMPNGIMAGYFDNTVAFCDPYHPYAWPIEYQISTEWPIIGLGVFGQTLFVGTTGNPYFIYGADSASMTAQKLDSNQSCVSRRSIATVQGGVLFASPDGLCVADQNGVNVVSLALYTREDWQKLDPSSMFAVEHEGIYYLFYSGSGGGCLTFDMGNKKLGRISLSASAAYTDKLTDTLYIANGSSIQAVFGGSARRTGKWRSALTTFPMQGSLAWLKVYGDQTVLDPVIVRWYGDGVLRHQSTVTSLNPVRLPPGRWLGHEVEVESASRVTSVVLASSTQELQAI